ncbi:16S rRNA pseudouridine(516) synthase RsuA [Pseudomaricurvus alkylphenolicus]|jgi:16S rRNA pseudouridine516 synthase|uniref:16S rRNA pseudouridine(516) synthase RsuA n=1 Tax=Pseudomaricurvus alkylphenolicus TaxID=1306991 RepID=UPI0014219EC5|nr:16S rRNA pseudouridine(516) synthase RsuA [Pseudomaricurvus alkylphenolicus]NIB43749.1 16S rRNA pseudouridine(516) synthase RsuA [Pseudomaricurvus alkylphenolicus]
MRLDKYVSQVSDLSRKEVKRLLRAGYISVDGETVKDAGMHIEDTMEVSIDGEPLQAPRSRYFMLNKPQGYVCVTKDRDHPTVLELLDEPNKEKLQIAGRLDIDTTGLVLLTDDGQWNHAVTSPKRDCRKTYLVTLANDIAEDTEARFQEGVLLEGELKITKPANLEVLFSNEARLTISEGKYHQVKRMFAAVGNRVEELHREQIGEIILDPDLTPGEYRELTEEEANSVLLQP